MNKVVEILMQRDKMDRNEAEKLVSEVKEMILENLDEAEEILMEELGLELDYIPDIIWN